MATKRGHTTTQLKRAQSAGATVHPVFGLVDKVVTHEPRTKFDPKPWTDGFFRYHAWELHPTDQD